MGKNISVIIGIVLIAFGILMPVGLIVVAESVIAFASLIGGEQSGSTWVYFLYGIPFLLIGAFILFRGRK
ncbi:hypothetical protein [Parvularcula sp. IMCC14364]|uniref:hypothetical protein n=1 Tax=Parvularcula sp. IMCC14364 TaxID=3067902 RepID=UPI0027410EEC|nr:hypothetical protein [Parvularcula sp. IMCC14364]